jgi:hypothetical protein
MVKGRMGGLGEKVTGDLLGFTQDCFLPHSGAGTPCGEPLVEQRLDAREKSGGKGLVPFVEERDHLAVTGIPF